MNVMSKMLDKINEFMCMDVMGLITPKDYKAVIVCAGDVTITYEAEYIYVGGVKSTIGIMFLSEGTCIIQGKHLKSIKFEGLLKELHVLKNDEQTSAANMCSGANSIIRFEADEGTFANTTNISYAWYNCSLLTKFPAIDFKSLTKHTNAWFNCGVIPRPEVKLK